MATAGNTVHKIQKFSYTNANNTTVYNSDLTVQGNLTVVGASVYAQTEVVLIKDNIITLNAAISQSGTPLFNAGIEVDRGNQPNVSLIWNESSQAWQFTNNGSTYESLGGGSSGVYANGAFLQANGAYAHANAAFISANNVAPQVQPAFDKANGAYAHANAAFVSANNVAPQVQPAFDKANAAYAFANTTTAWGTRQAFKATAGQTVFSPGSGYLAGYIDVYYNGLKLYGTEDYTATDGINVTLANPATVNSIIEIVGFGANVPVANIYVLNSMASLLNRETFFATASQTTFTPTLSYRVGYVDVYYNGLKMNIPEDVTANNGTTINFIGLTPTTNDVIEIVGLTPNVAIANAIPITGGTISGGLNIAGNLIPTSDNTYYLGSATNRWRSLYVGASSIDIDGIVLSNSGGTLAVTSSGSPSTFIDTFARGQANAAFSSANNVAPQLQPAFSTANSAALYANAAFIQTNAAFIKANSSVQYSVNTAVTDFLAMPMGTTAERPASAANGHMRYNTTLGRLETYLPTAGWTQIVSDSLLVQYVVVAGGGGGGRQHGGGGGAGGYRSSVTGESSGGGASAETVLSLLPGDYTVTVGGGGAGSTTASGGQYTGVRGANGSSSVFHTITSIGGGGAGSYRSSINVEANGNAGGSGGGSGSTENVGAASGNYGGAGEGGQGYPGGRSSYAGAGGGGAGGAGGNGAGEVPGGVGGTGGVGITSAITGTSVGRAGGGGGGIYGSGNGSTGTIGSATDGGASGGTGANNGNNAVSNKGGGGGGGGAYEYYGGSGGSGIVIVRYTGAQRATGGTVTTSGNFTIHTFTGSGTFSVT